ncbi:ATP-binding cassette domain-containing protein [Oenococcus sp.]|uniref:ATP-binding cassette domain-containing protein n=1 Tax=Oenococcus sp. TaxID=1979414 RepID=UPI0039E8AA2B
MSNFYKTINREWLDAQIPDRDQMYGDIPNINNIVETLSHKYEYMPEKKQIIEMDVVLKQKMYIDQYAIQQLFDLCKQNMVTSLERFARNNDTLKQEKDILATVEITLNLFQDQNGNTFHSFVTPRYNKTSNVIVLPSIFFAQYTFLNTLGNNDLAKSIVVFYLCHELTHAVMIRYKQFFKANTLEPLLLFEKNLYSQSYIETNFLRVGIESICDFFGSVSAVFFLRQQHFEDPVNCFFKSWAKTSRFYVNSKYMDLIKKKDPHGTIEARNQRYTPSSAGIEYFLMEGLKMKSKEKNKNLDLKWVMSNLPTWVLLLVILFALGGSLEGIISGYSFGQITQLATHGVNNIWLFVGRFVLLYLFTYTSLYLFICLQNLAIRYLNVALKSALIKKDFLVPYKEDDNNYFLNQIVADAKQIEQKYFSSLSMILQSFFTALVSAVFVLKINFVLGIVSVLFASMSMIPSMLGGKMMNEASSSWSKSNQTYLGHLKEILAGLDIIKNYRAQKSILDKSGHDLFNSENHYRIMNNKQFLFQYFSWICSTVSFLAPLAIGLYFHQNGLFSVSISVIVTLLLSSDSVIGNLRSVIQYSSAIKSTKSLRAGVIPVINVDSKQETTLDPAMNKDLIVRNLSFAYKSHEILQGISFSVPYGDKLLISGDSGSGKTTIFNLLTKKLPTTEGKITFGGRQINENDYAYITQENWVFDGSIQENLDLGQHFSKTDLLHSLKEVNLDLELGDTPLTYECGSEGKNLSGGQKQRLSIARALLRNRPLLLLDEVTASLDVKNSNKLRDIVYQLPQTVIEIAHHYNQEQIKEYKVKHLVLSNGYLKELHN